jgi:hypothetical protein
VTFRVKPDSCRLAGLMGAVRQDYSSADPMTGARHLVPTIPMSNMLLMGTQVNAIHSIPNNGLIPPIPDVGLIGMTRVWRDIAAYGPRRRWVDLEGSTLKRGANSGFSLISGHRGMPRGACRAGCRSARIIPNRVTSTAKR